MSLCWNHVLPRHHKIKTSGVSPWRDQRWYSATGLKSQNKSMWVPSLSPKNPSQPQCQSVELSVDLKLNLRSKTLSRSWSNIKTVTDKANICLGRAWTPVTQPGSSQGQPGYTDNPKSELSSRMNQEMVLVFENLY